MNQVQLSLNLCSSVKPPYHHQPQLCPLKAWNILLHFQVLCFQVFWDVMPSWINVLPWSCGLPPDSVRYSWEFEWNTMNKDGGRKVLWDVHIYIPIYMASHARSPESSGLQQFCFGQHLCCPVSHTRRISSFCYSKTLQHRLKKIKTKPLQSAGKHQPAIKSITSQRLECTEYTCDKHTAVHQTGNCWMER